jgi:hypothetical protein
MAYLSEKIGKGISFLGKNAIMIIIICVMCSSACALFIPGYVSGTFTSDIIDKEISMYFGGEIGISSKDVIKGIIWMIQFSLMTTVLFIIAYLYKHYIDKRIFDFKKWRDWKFFLIASVLPVIIVDILRKAGMSIGFDFGSDMVSNFIVMILSSLFVVIISAMILDEEKPPLVIDPLTIEKELMNNKME